MRKPLSSYEKKPTRDRTTLTNQPTKFGPTLSVKRNTARDKSRPSRRWSHIRVRNRPEPDFLNVLRSLGIDSKGSIPPAYVGWRADTTTLFVVLDRQKAGEINSLGSIPAP
jgi:hypothetical protein